MNKDNKRIPTCIYIFMIDEKNDLAPIQHVQAVCHYMRKAEIITVSNVSEKHLKGAKKNFFISLPSASGGRFNTLIRCILFQLKLINILIKIWLNKDSSLCILQRQSVSFFLPSVISRLLRIPCFAEVNGLLYQDMIDRHANYFNRYLNYTTEYITYKLCNTIIVVNENLIAPLISIYRLSYDKFKVVENGTYPRKWVDPIYAKKTMGIDIKTKIIGYIGSFARREGVDNLIKAMALIENQDVQLMIIGGGGKEDANLQRLALDLGLDGRVHFCGRFPYLTAMKYLEACDIFVHLRRKIEIEGFDSQGSPLKMLDYLNVGRPVVTTNISSYQFIAEKKFGLLAEDGDISGTAQAICKLINSNTKIQSGMLAHEYVTNNKLWSHSVIKLENIIIR